MTCPASLEQSAHDPSSTLAAPVGRHEGEVPRLGDAITARVHPLNVPGEEHIEEDVKDKNGCDGGEGEVVFGDGQL